MGLLRVIRPLTGSEPRDPVHASPVKSRAKNWASKSLRILSGTFLASNIMKDDDSSSFMSPMPDELYSPPTGDQCSLSIFSSKDISDSSGDKIDSVRLSFIHCADIIDLFPSTPIVSKSQTLHSRHSQPSRPLMFTALPREFSNEIDQVYGTYYPRDDTSCRASAGTIKRSSMSFPLFPSLMPSPCSSPSESFDMLTGARYLHPDNPPNYYGPDLDESPPDSFHSLSTGLPSTQNSPQSLASPLLLSPSFTIPSRPDTPLSSNLLPTHLATGPSLQDLRELKPPLFSSPPSPSSFRSATSRVPGLERRAPRSLRHRLNPICGPANPDGGHVPYGTIQF
jgi:hypothetical protein